uniref:Putative secreted protein n=1 Tax=Anopheles darlingi TaxID=43151 RepID=A0A2M4DML3_ANODA
MARAPFGSSIVLCCCECCCCCCCCSTLPVAILRLSNQRGYIREPISTFGAVPPPMCPSEGPPPPPPPRLLCCSSCTLLAALIRRIGCEQDLPSAQLASGQPHSSCFTSAVWRAIRCFSISWLTMVSTVSAVEISISFAVSGSSSLKNIGFS